MSHIDDLNPRRGLVQDMTRPTQRCLIHLKKLMEWIDGLLFANGKPPQESDLKYTNHQRLYTNHCRDHPCVLPGELHDNVQFNRLRRSQTRKNALLGFYSDCMKRKRKKGTKEIQKYKYTFPLTSALPTAFTTACECHSPSVVVHSEDQCHSVNHWGNH